MAAINPYLNFNGNTEDAFNFYRSVFGGEFQSLMRWSDNPDCAEWAEADKQKLMHISLPIGSNVLMGTDTLEAMGQSVTPGTNFSITISPDSRVEADRIFKELSAGGKVEMEMQDMFWGAYFGSFTDKFGIQWMINQEAGGNA
jgi:PhnB protein